MTYPPLSQRIEEAKLSTDEQREIGRRLEETKDPKERARLRNKLVSANLALVIHIQRTHGYRAPGMSDDDFVQEGVLGLMRAAEKYDWRRGAFTPFAWGYVRAAMSAAVDRTRRRLGGDLGRLTYVPLEEAPEPFEEASEPDPWHRDRILERIDRLSEIDREILSARLSGETYRSIGRRLGMRAQSAHERARRIFSDVMEGEDD